MGNAKKRDDDDFRIVLKVSRNSPMGLFIQKEMIRQGDSAPTSFIRRLIVQAMQGSGIPLTEPTRHETTSDDDNAVERALLGDMLED